MTGTELVEPTVVLQPMWITVAIQLLTLFVAAGISYGMTKMRLVTNEKEIMLLKKEVSQIQLDFQKWQRDRLSSVITGTDCEKMQTVCQQAISRKVDDLTIKLDTYIRVAQMNWQHLAMLTGAICHKSEIDPPELK
jgi:hypothetical protein